MKNIVLMDSGLGGLSALKVLYKKVPSFNFIYFADTKNLPYGAKTKNELLDITIQNIKDIKRKYNPHIIIFGCNTLGTTILKDIKKIFYDIKFFALTPNIKMALEMNKKNILVLATTQTINRLKKLTLYKNNKNNIILRKMPLLANKVEFYIKNPINIVPYLNQELGKYTCVDCIVLGCSHYYFVKKQLNQMFKLANIIDGTSILAKEVVDYIKLNNISTKDNGSLNINKNSSSIELVLTKDVPNKNSYLKIIKDIMKSKNCR